MQLALRTSKLLVQCALGIVGEALRLDKRARLLPVVLDVSSHRLHVRPERMHRRRLVGIVARGVVELQHEAYAVRAQGRVGPVDDFVLRGVVEHVLDSGEGVQDFRDVLRDGAVEVILGCEPELRKVLACDCRRQEREECVDAIL